MTDILTTARQAWLLTIVLAAVYGYLAGGVLDMVLRVAIQGAVIYLVLFVIVWWAERDGSDSAGSEDPGS
ncbi:hypothetical protein BRC77_11265 [Halobacteriales archaeon QH_8_64_26]|nr:MAG: hypothetical protein BRC77_11265 [Halobacteriales archaeon QH_8_64_26]